MPAQSTSEGLRGVATDARMIGDAIQAPPGSGQIPIISMALIDLPFSFVGDVASLLWVIKERRKEELHPSGKYHYLLSPPAHEEHGIGEKALSPEVGLK